MQIESFEEIQTNELVRKRLAKLWARECFRNTELENLHQQGKLSQKDMKSLMISVVDYTDKFLRRLSSMEGDHFIKILKQKDYEDLAKWDDPK